MRNVADVLKSIQNNLAKLNSPLADFKEFSNIYIILRGLANLFVEQSNDLVTERDNKFLMTAKGIELDRIGLLYGQTRATGEFARGYVLVKSLLANTRLEEGLILTTADGSNQYRLSTSIVLNSDFELPVEIVATAKKTESNLNAGTRLYSSFYPNVEFTIGKYRNSLSVPVLGLIGGRESEADDSFRDRLRLYIGSLEKGTLDSIKSTILSQEFKKVYILEQAPVTGYITIYVSSNNQEKIDDLYFLIDKVKPVGLSYEIQPIPLLSTDIRLNVTLTDNVDIDDTLNLIRSSIYNSVDDLELGDSLSINLLLSLILNVDGVRTATIINPTNDVIANFNELISISDIFINVLQGL